MAPRRRKQTADSQDPASQSKNEKPAPNMTAATDEAAASSGGARWSVQTQWLFFAVASGVCAAFNGAFAKLTTTELTSQLSVWLASLLHAGEYELYVEYLVRGSFFALNLIFNGVMWSLFTTALARGTSATQVSIINTSTNFMVTAMLGLAIFSEKLPPMWWAGASLLVIGNVIAGRQNDGEETKPTEATYTAVPQDEAEEPAEL